VVGSVRVNSEASVRKWGEVRGELGESGKTRSDLRRRSFKDTTGCDEHTNSSRDDDVQRAASIPADAPPFLCCSMYPNLLRSRGIYRPGRATDIREQSHRVPSRLRLKIRIISSFEI